MLKINDIQFSHPGQNVPFSFSLQIEPGEIVAVTGPSGSGKSTLLDLIAGFLTPVSGQIQLGGLDFVPLQPQNRPVSILFQADNLFDHLPVHKNLELGLPTNTSKAQMTEALSIALHEVGLSDYFDRPTKSLSGGQKQRIALARTLLRTKPVVLLDEPFSNLDEHTADTMRNLVTSLTRKYQWSTLIVSHLSKDSAEVADRCYALIDHKLVMR